MKKAILFFTVIFISTISSSQTPVIKWQKCMGGSDDDVAAQIITDWDGNILIGGSTLSNDGDIQLVSGYGNAVLIKIDTTGNLITSKCFGGATNTTLGTFIKNDLKKSILICGTTSSYDLDYFHGNQFTGGTDSYLLCVDSSNYQVWVRCYGGYDMDYGRQVIECSDGGFLLVSQVQATSVNSGDIHGLYGFEDWWVVKTDSAGSILWSRCLGGTGHDLIVSGCQLSNGNLVITGVNSSTDGDVTCSTPSFANRVVILDSLGNILIDDCFGSPFGTTGRDLFPTSDGGFFFGGSAYGNGGDVSGNHGQSDFWVYRSDSTGQILWSKCYGGTLDDALISFAPSSDGGFILTGESYSRPGNIGMNPDVIVVKIDSIGNQEWLKYLGGTNSDVGMASAELPNGDVVVVATTKSVDGDLVSVPQHGWPGNNEEIWVVDLSQTSDIASIDNYFSLLNVRRSPDGYELTIQSEKSFKATLRLVDLLGRVEYSSSEKLETGSNHFFIPAGNLNSLNLLVISTAEGEKVVKLF